MDLILLILKMASGYPLATFLHKRCTANRSRTMFTWWCACPNVVTFIWTVIAFIPPYTCMHLRFRVPIKIPVTLLEHCISHSEDFYRSTNLKGSWYPQTTYPKEKKDTVPRCCPRFHKCVRVKSWLMTRVEQASCTTRCQMCVKSPLSPAMPLGSGGRAFNWLMH